MGTNAGARIGGARGLDISPTRPAKIYDLGFGTTIVASFLIAPMSWFHHFVFLIPALAAFASILNFTEWRQSIRWNSALLLVTVMISVRWPIVMGDYRAAHPLMRIPLLGNIASDPRQPSP